MRVVTIGDWTGGSYVVVPAIVISAPGECRKLQPKFPSGLGPEADGRVGLVLPWVLATPRKAIVLATTLLMSATVQPHNVGS